MNLYFWKWQDPEGPRRRNIFDSYVGSNCRGYERATMGKMTLASISFLARPTRNTATAPSNHIIQCRHPHRYRTLDVAVQDPTAGGDRRSIPLDV